jgi:FkbM family methyltransferase
MEVDSREVIDWSVVFFGEYEKHMRDLLERSLRVGDVAIDVGANVGVHTLTMARLVGPAGRVLALEPNPSALKRLRRNVELNALEQVAVVPCAAGAYATRLQLRVPAEDSREGANPGLASLVALETPHSVVEVDVQPLDAVLRVEPLGQVSLIKIDVQGYECQVLRGATETLGMFAPLVVFEFEPWAWRQAERRWEDARDLLEGLSYELWRLDAAARGGLRLLPLTAMPRDHAEVVAMRGDGHQAGALRGRIAGPMDG